MAMTMSGEVKLPAGKQTVWARLNDPETLKACIPGCQELVKDSDTQFRATTKLAIGPVKATFKGKVTLSDIDAPNGYTISGEGEGGIAGFAKGGAKVRLEDADAGTLLHYEVHAQVGGKIAQLGARFCQVPCRCFGVGALAAQAAFGIRHRTFVVGDADFHRIDLRAEGGDFGSLSVGNQGPLAELAQQFGELGLLVRELTFRLSERARFDLELLLGGVQLIAQRPVARF